MQFMNISLLIKLQQGIRQVKFNLVEKAHK